MLKRDQFRSLHEALADAFDHAALERLVRFHLNRRLSDHVDPGPLSSIVFDLVGTADREGWVLDLLKAAGQDRPENPRLQAVLKEFDIAAPAVVAPVDAAAEGRRQRLDRALRGFRPRLGADDAADPHGAYTKATAVLAYFDPASLEPVPPVGADPRAAVADLLAQSVLVNRPGQPPRWTLRPDVRRRALEQLGRDGMRQALALNAGFADDPVQQLLAAYVRGLPAPAPRGDAADHWRAVLQVTEWLRGHVDGLPDPDDLRRRIDLAALLKPLRHLGGDHFRGRRAELDQLRDYVEVLGPSSVLQSVRRGFRSLLNLKERPPLVIHGPGGRGKSALLSRFILDHVDREPGPPLPFVYLDFDRPGLSAEEPLSLLLEAVRQLQAQFPASQPLRELYARWARQLAPAAGAGEPRGAGPQRQARLARADDRQAFLDGFGAALGDVGVADGPLLLVLDTFEEVQYHSADFVPQLWGFLDALQALVPRFRNVLADRAPVTEFPNEWLALSDLDAEAALGVLHAKGVTDPGLGAALYRQVGGNPLSLRLAAAVARQGGEAQSGGIRDLTTHNLFFLRVRDDVVQGQLYRRILGHIHQPDVRKLAHPGLVLRRITAALIRAVLAEPCGVPVPDDARAAELFEGLRREVALVRVGEDGALYHRADVRRVMLAFLRDQEPDKVLQIHRQAAAYYARRDDAVSRAEEIYHRIAAGEPVIAATARLRADLKPYLTGALEELPPAAQTHLAARLDITLPAEVLRLADQHDWERLAQRRARDLLAVGDPRKALEVLRERTARVAASPLFLLESVALRQPPEPDLVAAARAARDGATSAAEAGDSTQGLALLLELATVEERRENFDAARAALTEARGLSRRLGDDLGRMEAGVGLLRLGRKAGASAPPDAGPLRQELVELFERLPPDRQARHPVLLRRLAAELAPGDPLILRKVVSLVGLGDDLTPAAAKSLADVAARWDADPDLNVRHWAGQLADPALFENGLAEGLTTLAARPEGGPAAAALTRRLVESLPLDGDALRAFTDWLRQVLESEPPSLSWSLTEVGGGR